MQIYNTRYYHSCASMFWCFSHGDVSVGRLCEKNIGYPIKYPPQWFFAKTFSWGFWTIFFPLIPRKRFKCVESETCYEKMLWKVPQKTLKNGPYEYQSDTLPTELSWPDEWIKLSLIIYLFSVIEHMGHSLLMRDLHHIGPNVSPTLKNRGVGYGVTFAGARLWL